MGNVRVQVRWDGSDVDISEGSMINRFGEENAPAGLMAIAVVRACDAAGISIEDLGKTLIEESMRRRGSGA